MDHTTSKSSFLIPDGWHSAGATITSEDVQVSSGVFNVVLILATSSTAALVISKPLASRQVQGSFTPLFRDSKSPRLHMLFAVSPRTCRIRFRLRAMVVSVTDRSPPSQATRSPVKFPSAAFPPAAARTFKIRRRHKEARISISLEMARLAGISRLAVRSLLTSSTRRRSSISAANAC